MFSRVAAWYRSAQFLVFAGFLMDARGLRSGEQRTADNYQFVSCPNRSLTPTQQRWVFWGIAIPCLGIAVIFAGMGYWLMLPFAGLEIGLLAWAFENLRAHDRDYESISIQGDRVQLEWRDAGEVHRRELNTYWTQVECVCEQGQNRCRLSLRSHGEAIELGRYLDDQGRIKLAAAVRDNLSH